MRAWQMFTAVGVGSVAMIAAMSQGYVWPVRVFDGATAAGHMAAGGVVQVVHAGEWAWQRIIGNSHAAPVVPPVVPPQPLPQPAPGKGKGPRVLHPNAPTGIY